MTSPAVSPAPAATITLRLLSSPARLHFKGRRPDDAGLERLLRDAGAKYA
ncbi:hypothetical protein ACFZDJ_48715 [Streptomyces sp. NPDC007896]